MNAILLCRVSDLKQEDGYSLAAQEKFGLEYCEEYGFNVVDVFSFVETASKVHKRVKFNKMYDNLLGLIKKQKGKDPVILVVEKPDRLSRNLSDKELLDRHVSAGEIEIHYFKERKILNKKSTPADFFSNDVMTSLNKYMASNTGKESLKGMVQKAEEGLYPGKAPLGYVNIREGEIGKAKRKPSHIKIDESTYKGVYRMFELRSVMNLSLDSIRKTIIEENLLPINKIKTINKGSLQKILMNPFYSGKFIFQGKEYQGKHEVFIPQEWIDIAQGNTRYGGKRKPTGVFSGFFQCGNSDCGCNVIFDPKVKKIQSTGETKQYNYYHCTDGKNVHKNSNEKQINVNEDQLWIQLAKPVSEISIDEDFAKVLSEALRKTHNKMKDLHQKSIEKYKLSIIALEKEEDESADALIGKKIDQEVYDRRITKIRSEKRIIENQLALAISTVGDDFMINANKILELSNRAVLLWETRKPHEKLNFLKKILSNQVLDGVTIKYCLKKPFDVLSKMKGNEKWCPRRDLNSYAR